MKQDLRVAVTKRMIHEGLLQLLEKKNIDKIKVSELCQVSGVNRATFYRHYETLQDVLREIALEFAAQIPHCPPPRSVQDIHDGMVQTYTYLWDHADTMKLLFHNRTDDEMNDIQMEFCREILEHHRENAPGMEMDEDTFQIMMALFCGGSQRLIKKWLMGEIRKTPEELADIMCRMLQFRPSFPSG